MGSLKRVLFVCTGNTCRSPMAEGMFRKAVENRADYSVGSAGVSAAVGSSANRETVALLQKRSITLDGFRSRQITAGMLSEATHVFAMTRDHLEMLEEEFPEHSDKFYLMCEFADIPGKGLGCDVPDPIGMGRKAYEDVAAVFEHAIPAIIAYIDKTTGKGD